MKNFRFPNRKREGEIFPYCREATNRNLAHLPTKPSPTSPHSPLSFPSLPAFPAAPFPSLPAFPAAVPLTPRHPAAFSIKMRLPAAVSRGSACDCACPQMVHVDVRDSTPPNQLIIGLHIMYYEFVLPTFV